MPKLALKGGTPLRTNLFPAHNFIGDDEKRAVIEVLEKGKLSGFLAGWNPSFFGGEKVREFEQRWADYVGAKHAVTFNSNTSGLFAAIGAAGVGPGDEVIVTPYSMSATATVIIAYNGVPVFADITDDIYCLDPQEIQNKITPRTKAIMVTDVFGHAADIDEIMAIAAEHNLIVIEDAAQAHGAEYKGRRVGSIGDMGCFSFYPGKNLGAYGEGGAVVTNDDGYQKTIRMLRDWGQSRRYHHDLKGFNYRLEGMQGAILGVKLKHLDAWTNARRRNAALYNKSLAGADVESPLEMNYSRHVYHVYAVRTPSRDSLAKELNAQGVQTGIHYPIPVHLQEAYADSAYRAGDFPHAERAAAEVLSLPMFPELTEEQVRQASEAVLNAATSVGV